MDKKNEIINLIAKYGYTVTVVAKMCNYTVGEFLDKCSNTHSFLVDDMELLTKLLHISNPINFFVLQVDCAKTE